MIEMREHICPRGRNPFKDWFKSLDSTVAIKISSALFRMENGNLSSVKSVGMGVQEYRIHWRPGYRIYFGRDGDKIIILLGGGTKKSQKMDIAKAHKLWAEYKSLKRKSK